jgi:hypothetical protein
MTARKPLSLNGLRQMRCYRTVSSVGPYIVDHRSRLILKVTGEMPEEDKQENEFSVQHGFRILSAYTTIAGDRIWVMTEADRSATTFLLPEEY